jgi:hypothetical protein
MNIITVNLEKDEVWQDGNYCNFYEAGIIGMTNEDEIRDFLIEKQSYRNTEKTIVNFE